MNTNPNLVEDGRFTRREGALTGEQSEVDALLLNVTDQELLDEIKERLDSAEIDMGNTRKVQKINEEYYLGDQLKRIDLLNWQTPVTENRMFLSAETLIPIITANPGDPDIRPLFKPPVAPPAQVDPASGQPMPQQPDPANMTEEAVGDYVDTLTDMLLYDYDVTYRLKDKIRQMIRHWFMYRFGVAKFRYDALTGEIVFELVNPRNMILPGKNSPAGWKAEFKENTIAELLVLFPKAKDKITQLFWQKGDDIPARILGTKVGYYEYWRPTFVAWKLNDVILDKRKNPNWDWVGETKVIGERPQQLKSGAIVAQPVSDKFKWNILSKPRDPYFIFNFFTVSGTEYDDTGYFEQARPLQDIINKRKRQIAATADDSGILIGSGESGLLQEEFEKYDGSPRSKIFIPQGNPNEVFTRLPAAPLAAGMIEDLQDSRQAIDNIFGTQGTLRGEQSANETATGRQILRNADITRAAPLAERVEDLLQEIYLYDIQMRLLFTDEDYNVPVNSAASDHETENRVFNKYAIPMVKVKKTMVLDGQSVTDEYFTPIPITLTVRKNSTLPKDLVAEYERDIEAFKSGLIDPLTVYERTNQTNPTQKLERLFRWLHFPITMLDKESQTELMPLFQNPPAPPPIRRNNIAIDFKDLPPEAQMGALEESGILKGEKDAIPMEIELRQQKAQQQLNDQQTLDQKAQPTAKPAAKAAAKAKPKAKKS